MSYLKSYKLFESKFTDDYDLSKHNFNCGDCDVYAIALHKIYGYPLYVVNGYFKEDDWNEEEGFTGYWNEPAHIVVKLPNGNYMDSDGEITEQQLKDDCAFSNKVEYIKIEEITEEEAMHVYSGEDQEEDIQRIIKFIKNKSNISESFINKEVNEEDINNLYVEFIDLGFNVELVKYDTSFINGFKVILEGLPRIEGNKTFTPHLLLDNVFDTLLVAEEYILDVYERPIVTIYISYTCMSNPSIRSMNLNELFDINKKVVEDYDNPYFNKIEMYFQVEKPKELSRFKKFINRFNK